MPGIVKNAGDCFDALINGRMVQLCVRAFRANGRIKGSRVTQPDDKAGTRVSTAIHVIRLESALESTLPPNVQEDARRIVAPAPSGN